MRYRRADPAWAALLLLSAGLSLPVALTFDGGGWLALPMAALACPAGRRLVSLPLALRVFTAVASTGLALALWRSTDPLADWLSVVFVELTASVLPWSFGRYRRLRAEQRERERDVVAEQARLRERARIAREMHDLLGHELALIALRGGALELAAGLTDQQRAAVGELRAGAVRATDRLHDVVEVLGGADGAADLRPADEGVDDLVRRAAAAGLRVRLRRDGPPGPWSAMTGQAAHRVVREALTNAARHAPGARVTVTITRQGEGTRVEVVNDAAARPAVGGGTGRGLVGLAERVQLVGGRLDAGPSPGGGWAVVAVLPDDVAPQGTTPSRAEVGRRGSGLGVAGRRARLRAAALPLCAGLALLAALACAQVATVAGTGLAHDRYDGLRPGQPLADIAGLLPPRDLDPEPGLVAAPPPPVGARCVHYPAGDGLLDLGPEVYRLCFVGDVLASKNRLERA